MDKIQKFLDQLVEHEYQVVCQVLAKIVADNFVGLQIKKLQGRNSYYRVRIGQIRIIFVKSVEGNVIMAVSRKNDNTYKL